MTEREKRIEDLSTLLAYIFVENMKPNGIKYEDIAEALDDADYRKANDVRKEILEELKKKRFDDREFDKFTGSRYIVLWKDVVEVFKKFGV